MVELRGQHQPPDILPEVAEREPIFLTRHLVAFMAVVVVATTYREIQLVDHLFMVAREEIAD
jgi:hypothetical protein